MTTGSSVIFREHISAGVKAFKGLNMHKCHQLSALDYYERRNEVIPFTCCACLLARYAIYAALKFN